MARAKYSRLRFALKGLGVLIGILALVFLVATYFFAQHDSTRSGPLGARVTAYLLGELPALDDGSDDGLRFVAQDSWTDDIFALAISHQGGPADGIARITDGESGEVLTREFSIPSAVYQKMMEEFDSKVDGYWGSASVTTDGTGVAFERKRAGQIVSAIGNSPCHYAVITNILARDLAAYVPELGKMADPTAEAYAQSEHCDQFLWIGY